jgi:signal transduction histidine kinase
LEQEKLQLNPEPFNIYETVENVVELHRNQSELKKLELESEVHIADPYVHNDPKRTEQILINLVSNAVKFSRSGKIKIIVKDFYNYCWIEVSD